MGIDKPKSVNVLETIKKHIENTNTNFLWEGMIVPKEDMLKYIQNEIDRLNELNIRFIERLKIVQEDLLNLKIPDTAKHRLKGEELILIDIFKNL